MSDHRLAFAVAAESLAGVRFRFRGRDSRRGLDCVGLVIAGLEAIGCPVEPLPRYSLRQRSFTAELGSLPSRLFEEASNQPAPGDVLLVQPGPAQVHLLVVGPTGGFVHAHAGLGKVVVTPPPCPWPIECHWRLRKQ